MYMNSLEDASFKVASFNRTLNRETHQITDDACLVVISWDKIAANNIEDLMRPKSCID